MFVRDVLKIGLRTHTKKTPFIDKWLQVIHHCNKLLWMFASNELILVNRSAISEFYYDVDDQSRRVGSIPIWIMQKSIINLPGQQLLQFVPIQSLRYAMKLSKSYHIVHEVFPYSSLFISCLSSGFPLIVYKTVTSHIVYALFAALLWYHITILTSLSGD